MAPLDASAAQIECWTNAFYWETVGLDQDGEEAPGTELLHDIGSDVEGIPVCCEVCAVRSTADAACKDTCLEALCQEASDYHFSVAVNLGTCDLVSGCGFEFGTCATGLPFPQMVNLVGDDNDFTYLLHASCSASAAEPARPDGLFEYLEELEGVPGGGPKLDDVDVVEYCIEAHDTDGLPADGGDAGGGYGGSAGTEAADNTGADSTGSGSDSTDAGSSDTGGAPSGVEPPEPCGPFAEQRYWVSPSSNFATWSRSGSSGSASDGSTTYPMAVTGGGLEYTVLPCPQGRCVRIDKLSAFLEQVGGGQEVAIAMLAPSDLLPIAPDDTFVIPAQSMSFAGRYTFDGHRYTVEATNDVDVGGTIDKAAGNILLRRFDASSSSGNLSSLLTLSGDLDNTQPETSIVVTPTAWNQVNLRALTVDAENDPVEHSWRVFGVGAFTGDSVEVTLEPGTYPVALLAEDVHRARSVDATWVTIAQPGS